MCAYRHHATARPPRRPRESRYDVIEDFRGRLAPGTLPPTALEGLDYLSSLSGPCADSRYDHKKFTGYTDVTPLGRGGMSHIFRAFDPSLGHHVALKVSAKAEFQASLFNGARFQAAPESDAIVPFCDIGFTSDDLPFVAMPLLDGNLRTLADEGFPRWSAAQQHDIVRQTVAALADVHAQGIMHGDISAENFLVSGTQVYLHDFDVAQRVTDPRPDHGAAPTFVNPAYTPPERLQQPAEPLTMASDIFSLGVTIANLLTGEPVYFAQGHSHQTESATTALSGVIATEPLHRLAPHWRTFALRATAVDPADRYPHAGAMLAALSNFFAGGSI